MGNVVAMKRHDAAFFAEHVRAALTKSVEGFLEAGDWLGKAKGALKHGEWIKMLETVPLERSKAAMLMKIADHEVISNVEHVQHLPPSWGTLYKLTMLPSPLLEAKIGDGTINPQMERKQVMELRAENGLAPKKRDKPITQPERIYEVILEAGPEGLLNKEIAEKTGIKLGTVSGRVSSLKVLGTVAELGKKTPDGFRVAARHLVPENPKKKKPAEPSKSTAPDQAVEDALAAFVAAIKDKSDSQRVKIMLEACDRAKVAVVEVSTLSDKRAKAAGLVDFLPFAVKPTRAPRKPKKEGQ